MELSSDLRRTFLQSFMIARDMPPSVIVSPSYSGLYSIPLLLLHPQEVMAFVSIAATNTHDVPYDLLSNVTVCG